MSLGLRQAGFDIVKAFDAWPLAVDTYNRNIGSHAEVRDLGDLLGIIPELIALAPDMIAGGPPCQDYSSAGLREEAANAKLTLAFAVLVATVRPRWFVMENVINAMKSETWAQARSILMAAGYGLTESKNHRAADAYSLSEGSGNAMVSLRPRSRQRQHPNR